MYMAAGNAGEQTLSLLEGNAPKRFLANQQKWTNQSLQAISWYWFTPSSCIVSAPPPSQWLPHNQFRCREDARIPSLPPLRLIVTHSHEQDLPRAVLPTFEGVDRRVESYVLDRDDLELYGVEIAVDFTHRIRGMVKFDAIEDLVTQMNDDVDRVRDLLTGSTTAR